MRRLFSLLTVMAAVVSACDRDGVVDEAPPRQELITPAPPLGISIWISPTERPEEELTFARLAPGVEAEVQQASFWAVSGQERTLVIHYQGADSTAAPLLEFRVGALSLAKYPDGLPVLPGDSVQITVTLDTQRRFIFDFQPAGLTFSPADPALLRLNHEAADDDVDGDGTTELLDTVLQQQFRIWRQDLPGLPWQLLPSIRLPGVDIIEGHVTHFTGFAMAS